MRTIAITHKIDEGNVQPFTRDELDYLIGKSRIAIGTNWRGRDESEWANSPKAREEFDLFDLLASEGGVVIANYQGLGPYKRIVGRVVPTATGKPELWRDHDIRVLQLLSAKRINTRAAAVDDLQVLRGRTIVDVTTRAGDRVLRLIETDEATEE